MNRFLSWILMVIYLSASVKILMPLVQDCIAHVFFLEQHLEQAHDNNTQNNHISGEVIEMIKQGNDQRPFPKAYFVLNQANLSLHYFHDYFFHDIELIISTKSIFSYHLLLHDNIWAEDIAPPPRQA